MYITLKTDAHSDYIQKRYILGNVNGKNNYNQVEVLLRIYIHWEVNIVLFITQ